jgi:hypothetical protein
MAQQDEDMPDVAVDNQPGPTALEIDPHERFLRTVYMPSNAPAVLEFQLIFCLASRFYRHSSLF